MRKNKIAFSVFAAASIISIILGYSLIKQNEYHKYDQLSFMTQQEDGTYIKSNVSVFKNYDYEFDHAVCNNGSEVTANSNGGVNLKLLGTDKCTVYLKPTVIGKIKSHVQITKPDFTQTAQETGLYTYEDDYGTSYYFRGDVNNNYIKFGDYIWRIVRINGDGSVRIIYDGTTPHANGEESLDRVLSNSEFNSSWSKQAYIGYMYGNINSTIYNEMHANTISSAIKTYLDSWYKTNIKDKGLAKYVSDNIFCNDRSIASTSTEYGVTLTRYGAYGRNDTYPILTCKQKNDAFTVDDTVKGNGALTYPIGLLTADEYRLAGGYNGPSSNLYINKPGTNWWLGSPGYHNSDRAGNAYNFIIIDDGRMGYYYVGYSHAVVPVINLTAEYVNQLSGSGTKSDPYAIKNTLANYITNLAGTTISDYDGATSYSGAVVNEYGIRYEGQNPNNYVKFNNELWRIIGVFDEDTHGRSGEQLVKIIRTDSIGNLAWSSNDKNNWNEASLKTLLNGDYINDQSGTYTSTSSVRGLNSKALSQIQPIYWKIGTSPDGSSSSELYENERGSTASTSESTAVSTEALSIGIMYPSDYGFAVLSSSCSRSTSLFSYNGTCSSDNWLFNNTFEWFITPSYNILCAYYLMPAGYVGTTYYQSTVSGSGAIRPTAYLKSSVSFLSGKGTIKDPYIIE